PFTRRFPAPRALHPFPTRRSSDLRVQRSAPAELDWEVEASQDAPRYATGERVRHRKFGGGVVRAVSGSGRELKVTVEFDDQEIGDRKSTRLNSSHVKISYAVFCLK